MEEYDFNKLGFVFRSIAAFLGTAGNAECVIPTRVKLLISGNFPSGASRFNFGDLIILNVSRVPVTKKSRVIGALIHEFTHLINNKIGLLPKIIKTINYPNINVQEGYKWQYFVTETILKSISSHRANAYVGEFLDFDDETKRRDEDVSYKLPLRKYGYEFLIRVAASRFLSQTINYIETGKIIDAAYVNNAVNILANLLQEREEETAKET